eukprot:NODE_1384_length_1173_cov_0.694600.p2 type:complete len:171 gc:universal NODE_1384_length_1173_cov_0.694600:581-1093(+)
MSLFLAVSYMGFLGAIYVGIVKFLQYRKGKAKTDYFTFEETTIFNDLVEQEAEVRKIAPALMKRAVANIKKMMKLREDKQAVSILLKYGSVGDDLWNELQNAEQVLSQEIMDTVESADLVKPGWGQSIFPEAQQIVAVEQQKEQVENQKRVQKMMQQMKQQQAMEQQSLE